MTLIFSKFKFTTGFFYKRIESAEVKVFDDRFEVGIYPYWNYAGTYYIDSVLVKESNRIVYRTRKCLNKENDNPNIIRGINEFFISLHNDNSKFMIFTADTTGIIFKR